MSIEAVKSAIAEKMRQAEAKRAEAVILEAEAKAMNVTLSMLLPVLAKEGQPLPTISQAPQRDAAAAVIRLKSRSLGRQPGALSNKWKRHLLELREAGDTFSYDDVIRVVQAREGRQMRQSEVRRLFEKWAPYGHIKLDDKDRIAVPQQAADRFRATLGSDADEEDDAENEAADEIGQPEESPAETSTGPSEKPPLFG